MRKLSIFFILIIFAAKMPLFTFALHAAPAPLNIGQATKKDLYKKTTIFLPSPLAKGMLQDYQKQLAFTQEHVRSKKKNFKSKVSQAR